MLDRASRLLSQHLSYVPIISWVPVGTVKSVPTSTEISANFAASIVFTRRMRCRDCNTTRYVRYCLAIASLSIHLFFFRTVCFNTNWTWKNPLPLPVLATRPAGFAWRSSGRSCLRPSNVSDCCPTARIASGNTTILPVLHCWAIFDLIPFTSTAWTAFASGDKRSSLRTRSFGPARNAESNQISCAPVATGAKRKKRRKS